MKTLPKSTVSHRSITAAVAATVLLLGSSAFLRAADQAKAAPSTAPQTQAQSAPETEDAKPQERIISLVLLTKEARELNHDLIAHAVSEGVGAKVSAEDVITKSPYHLVTIGSDKFIINAIGQPYFEKPTKVANETKDANVSRAVRDHRGWISVDWVTNEEQPDLRKVYTMIGKMVAHLSDKGTLAVYSPDMDQFAIWAPSVREGLESDDPLAVFEPAESAQSTPAAPAPSATP